MKYLRLFETLNISSKLSVIEQYQRVVQDVEPLVLFIYEQQASKIDFEDVDEDNDNGLVDIGMYESIELESVHISGKDTLRFTLLMYENIMAYERNEPEIKYFFLSIEDLERGQIEIEAEKYNM